MTLDGQLEQLEAFTTAAKDQCVDAEQYRAADQLLRALDAIGRARLNLSPGEDELAAAAVRRLAEDEES